MTRKIGDFSKLAGASEIVSGERQGDRLDRGFESHSLRHVANCIPYNSLCKQLVLACSSNHNTVHNITQMFTVNVRSAWDLKESWERLNKGRTKRSSLFTA
jgi:hypothetical protein